MSEQTIEEQEKTGLSGKHVLLATGLCLATTVPFLHNFTVVTGSAFVLAQVMVYVFIFRQIFESK
jgi:hypothetical protein